MLSRRRTDSSHGLFRRLRAYHRLEKNPGSFELYSTRRRRLVGPPRISPPSSKVDVSAAAASNDVRLRVSLSLTVSVTSLLCQEPDGPFSVTRYALLKKCAGTTLLGNTLMHKIRYLIGSLSHFGTMIYRT